MLCMSDSLIGEDSETDYVPHKLHNSNTVKFCIHCGYNPTYLYLTASIMLMTVAGSVSINVVVS